MSIKRVVLKEYWKEERDRILRTSSWINCPLWN